MHLWKITKWEKRIPAAKIQASSELLLVYEGDINPDVAAACAAFANWAQNAYRFPLRLTIHVKACERITAMDGDSVVGTFFEPPEYSNDSFIQIATGDYPQLKSARGQDNALAAILVTLFHEITHYFQWINGIQLSEKAIERQADRYSRCILNEYAATRDHP